MTATEIRNLTMALRQSSDFAYMQGHRAGGQPELRSFWIGKAEGLNEASNLLAAQLRRIEGEEA